MDGGIVEIKTSSIYAAVAKAMGAIKRVTKGGRNVEQKYDFASTDDFFEMVGPICAENGLVTTMEETAIDYFERQGKWGPTHWVQIKYALTTHYIDGSNLPTVTRTVEVIRTGAQSFGSAQSYVLKQYYRGLLLIPTGDKDDADLGERGQGDVARVHVSPQDTIDARAKRETDAITQLMHATTEDEMRAVWQGLDGDVRAAPMVAKAKDEAKAMMAKSADLGDDKIPY